MHGLFRKVALVELSRCPLLTGIAGLQYTVCNATKNELLTKGIFLMATNLFLFLFIHDILYAHVLPSIYFFFRRSDMLHKKLLRVARKTMLLRVARKNISHRSCVARQKYDLVYFTTRVPDTSDMIMTRTTRVQRKCDTNDTTGTRVRHE